MPTDTTVSYSKQGVTPLDEQTYLAEYGLNTSRSTMLNGRIDRLSQNPHVLDKRISRLDHQVLGTSPIYYPMAPTAGVRVLNPFFDEDPFWLALEQTALSRFNGRLKTGAASLGVTLASWRQSREMITRRLMQADIPLKAAEMQFRRASKKELRSIRRSLTPDSLASKVLEVEFGWRPLFSDIHAATSTVCKDGIPPAFIVGRARSPVSGKTVVTASPPWVPQSIVRWQGTGLVTVAASVAISNPNLWLANRLGLINPLVVAWDLVPWSFLVNMFVNVNQVLESFTAHVGLTIANKSTTRSSSAVRTALVGPTSSGFVYKGQSSSLTGERSRRRLAGSMPTRSFTVKVPELNWELALIASSLVVQRITRINKLLFR